MINVVPTLERIARFFRLPQVIYDPVTEVAREGPHTWPRLYFANFIMMCASLVATWQVTHQPWLAAEMALVLICAGPTAYRLHYRDTSRLLVNWLSFTSALIIGIVQWKVVWPLTGGLLAAEDFDVVAFLVITFMWITAFRAFSVRTVTDLVQTILPCGSIMLLVLLLKPNPATLGCLALVMLSTLALLAGEYRVQSVRVMQPVSRVTRSRNLRRTGAFYSWPTLYGLVLLVAVGTAYVAARAELSGGWGDVVRYALARQIYRFFAPREIAAIADNTVVLARLSSWPNRDLPVFKVFTKTPGNYRVTCYHKYDGVRWERGRLRATKAPYKALQYRVPLAECGAAMAGSTRVEQRITAVRYIMYSLPSLYAAVRVQGQLGKVRYDRDRVLFTSNWVRPGDSYDLVSFVPPVVAMKRPGAEVPPEDLARDLQLPDTLPQRVRDLAQQLTAAEKTPFDKARAIEQHLMWGYKYTLEAPSSWPNDFVDHFLFVSKRGFCHHFAGSMVIMCRSLGMPARLVSGYLRGDEDKDTPDLFTVREKDAHVWPEVYFAGAGWVPFEPTPAAEEERRPLADAWEAVSKSVVSGWQKTWGFLQTSWPSALAGLVALSLLAVVGRHLHAKRLPRGFRQRPELARVVRAYLRLRRALGDHGAPVGQHLAPREVLAGLPPHLAPVAAEAERLTAHYTALRFGRGDVQDTDVVEAEALLAAFRKRLREVKTPRR